MRFRICKLKGRPISFYVSNPYIITNTYYILNIHTNNDNARIFNMNRTTPVSNRNSKLCKSTNNTKTAPAVRIIREFQTFPKEIAILYMGYVWERSVEIYMYIEFSHNALCVATWDGSLVYYKKTDKIEFQWCIDWKDIQYRCTVYSLYYPYIENGDLRKPTVKLLLSLSLHICILCPYLVYVLCFPVLGYVLFHI